MVGGRNTDRSRKMKRTKASPRAVALLRKKKMAKMLRRKAAESFAVEGSAEEREEQAQICGSEGEEERSAVDGRDQESVAEETSGLEHDTEEAEEHDAVEEEGEESEEGEGESASEEVAHSRLLSAISGLGRKRRRGQRSEATPTVSQYQLASHTEGEGVSVGGLLGGLGREGKGVGGLRRKLATAASHQLLPPATKQQIEKANRALAYSSACKDVGKWLPVVTHNRRAEHLSFPLQEEAPPLPSLASRTEGFQVVTELERAVWGVVGRSEGVIEATDTELTAAERAELVRVMGEEGRERVRESRRWRVLMSQYEAKCQRERRIKSRRFHKVQRRRRQTPQSAAGGQEGEEERAERLRATERMTLRHGRQGKWAREVLARKKRDPAARTALSEHSLRSRALTQHAEVESEGDSEGEAEAGELSDPRPAPATLPDRHSNPWLHSGPLLLLGSGASQPARLGSGGEEDSEASQGEQEVNFDPSIHLIEEPADGVGQSSDVTACPSTKNKSRLGKKQSSDVTASSRLTKPDKKQSSDITSSHIDPKAYLRSEKEAGLLDVASQQLLNVREAFAGDDVVAEFSREKEAEEGKKAEGETVGLDLPGWGSWGGEGAKPHKRRPVQPRKSVQRRSDRQLDHVIINDQESRKLGKHLVSSLPWPFSSPQQFSRTQATPLGRHWNSEEVFRQLVTPRVERAVGVAIPPLRLTDDVEDFMRRSGQGKRGRGQGTGRRRPHT